MSEGPSHPRCSAISDLQGLSVEVNIGTSYFVPTIEHQLKISAVSVLIMRVLNGRLGFKKKKKAYKHTLKRMQLAVIRIQVFDRKAILHYFLAI